MPVRAALKTRTDPTHRRLDDAFGHVNLATFSGYALFLRVHERSYAALSEMAHADRALSTLVSAVHPLLQQDLKSLGIKAHAAHATGAVPALHPLGVRYVLAGSHFGKRVLLKRWSRSEDVRVLRAGTYLDSDLLRDDWPSVLSALSYVPPDAPDADAIVDSALWTFNLFGTCLKDMQGADMEAACGSA